ncbi:unnamed protein product [Linum trigynum]|uniref:Cytochrome P450 n=1 Tax=Linum trigynum TaxID=586398 RepID=A0AAV2CQ32_9ROSI
MATIPLLAILLLILLSFTFLLWRPSIASIRNKNFSLLEWPLLGMLPGLLWNVWADDLHGCITRTLKENGGTIVFKGPSFADMNFIVTCDPINAHHIFSKSYAKYGKNEDFRAMFEVLGDGIFNVDGESWKFQRQMLHSILNNEELQNHMMTTLKQKMEGTLFRILDDYCSSRTGAEVDMQDVAKKFMFDNICLWVLGFDPGYLCVDERSKTFSCGKAFEEIEEGIIYRHIVPKGVWEFQKRFEIGSEKKISLSTKVLDEFLYNAVKIKKQEMLHKEEQRQHHDMLTQWLVADHQSPDKFLRDIALTLISAGRDTLSSTLSLLLWLVATHPDVERKILGEIERVIIVMTRTARGTSRFLISKDDLNELVYLHAAIYETLRLYPPLPFEHRCANEADVLPSGQKVHKGMRMLFSMYSMGRMEETWGKDCMDFKPERWISDEGNIIHVPSQKFMTFLTGPRTCLGKAMSFMLLKFMVSSILWNYKFEMVEGHIVKPTPSMVLSMKDGLKMRVSKRNV